MLTGFLLVALAGCGFMALAFLREATDSERWIGSGVESDTVPLFPYARMVDVSGDFSEWTSDVAKEQG